MQTLGLSDSTPKPENRIKALLWPAIRHETDVDYVTRQGFWVCFAVAAFSLVVGAFQGRLVFAIECFEAAFFFLSGVGVRMRSVFAATCVFFAYFAGSFFVGFSIIRVVATALLLANVRGTWLSSQWRATQDEPPPVPLNETIADKLSDRLPIGIWPYTRHLYYVLAVCEGILLALGVVGSIYKRVGQ